MLKKAITIGTLLYLLVSSVPLAYGQVLIDPSLKPGNAPDMTFVSDSKTCGEMGGTWKNNVCVPKNAEDPVTIYIQIFAGALVMLSGGIAVIVIAVGGVLYIAAHGNQQQLEKAKNTLTFGVMGMLIVIFSYMIVRVVLMFVTGNL